MAKDTKNAQQPAAADAADPQVVAKQKRKKLILIIGAVLLLVGISVGVTLTLLSVFSDAPAADAEAASEAEPTKQPAIYYPLSPAFVVNFEDRGRSRFLQAELTLLLRDPDVPKALDMHMPAIRNALVMLLSGQSFETLQTAEGKEALREQALVKIQEVLQQEIGKPGIEQVLFVNFVMQ
ncbi:flagellar basal body-associated FliL family protein [Cellvibrio sp. ARAG 10.3]|uniref:flagellar basal body-associated FliL family protein n=1 Tax=Cellvibrio sp. ARAG 10.3 TaxID=3451358 RepID=UPI003F48812F